MKYTVNEFAQEIRNLYPGDYDDLSNKKLVKLWLKKYPKDKEKIDYNETSKIQIKPEIEEKKENVVYHKSNWGNQVLKVAVVLVLLFFSIIKNPTKEDFMNEVAIKYIAKVSNDIQQNGLNSIFESFLGTSLDILKDPSVERNDFLIFSKFRFRDLEAIGFWGNIYFTKGKTNPEIQSTQQQPSQEQPIRGGYENTAEGLRSFLKANWNGFPVDNVVITPIDDNRWLIKIPTTKENPDGFQDQIGTYTNGTFSTVNK